MPIFLSEEFDDEMLSEDLVLTEGTKYDKKAAKVLSDCDLFDEETSQKIIDALFRQDIHAFTHAPAWLEKYLVGIAGMIVYEAKGSAQSAKGFLEVCPPVFNDYLTWVKEYRPKLSDKEKVEFDNKFIHDMTFQDVKDAVEKIQAERDAQSRAELADMTFEESNYNLVPIESYEDFHEKYGGRVTGDGKSDEYAGNGGTAWCHANSKATYNRWVASTNKFFVLERKDWRDIPFNPETNESTKGKDDYGNSLIALLVNKRGSLKNATLRCNHVGVPEDADHQYKTYAELSKLVGFNVEAAVKDTIGEFEEGSIDKCFILIDENVFEWDHDYASDHGFCKEDVVSVTIPNGVIRIEEDVFNGCSNLESVTLPDSLTSIGRRAFAHCHSLKTITIPNKINRIGDNAFWGCKNLSKVVWNAEYCVSAGSSMNPAFEGCISLRQVVFGWSAFCIPNHAFSNCTGLVSVVIPENSRMEIIGDYAFSECSNLGTVTFPDSIKSFGDSAFSSCYDITSVILPRGLRNTGTATFETCFHIRTVTIPDSVGTIGSWVFFNCPDLAQVNIGSGVKAIQEHAFAGCKSLSSITYNGTKAEWDAIQKEEDWINKTGKYTVHCTDGDISKNTSESLSEGFYLAESDDGEFDFEELQDRAVEIDDDIEAYLEDLPYSSIKRYMDRVGGKVEEIDIHSPCFVDRYGEIYSVVKSNAVVLGGDRDNATHGDYLDEILQIIYNESHLYDNPLDKECVDGGWINEDSHKDALQDAMDKVGILRINTGTNAVEHRFYCVLPGVNDYRLNESQLEALNKFFWLAKELNKDRIIIFFGDDYRFQYRLRDDFSPDDLTEEVRKYYEGNKLHSRWDEDLDEDIDDLRRVLTEGTRYDKQAAKIIADSGLYDLETSEKIIDALFHEDIHAFVHAPNWLEKYLKGIARMLVEEANDNKEMAHMFLTECPAIFDEYLTWVKENRDSAGGASFDNKFVNTLRYAEIEEFIRDIHAKRDAESKEKLASMEFGESDYKLVPIESYEQMNDLYGGKLTGDGSSDDYAGHGGTAWCHTNSEAVYNDWANGGRQFFVLERNGWKDIPFDKESNNLHKGKDAYGNSLIAIRVSRGGELLNATLRCNHVGVSRNADNQYKTYAELSEVAGFNVEDAVNEYLDAHPTGYHIKGTPFYVDRGVITRDTEVVPLVDQLVVPDGVERIGDYLCDHAQNLVSVTLSNTVKEIGEDAFYGCRALEAVDLNYGLETIKEGAFSRCSSLKEIVIPDSVTNIGNGVFIRCENLERAYLPANIGEIPSNCFAFCKNLKEVPIPFGVRSIAPWAFKSSGIQRIKIPSSVLEIHSGAFHDCEELTSVSIPGSVKEIGATAFRYCDKLASVGLGDGVRKIGEAAFADCGNLHTIFIPESVEKIEYLAFVGCPLDKIRIDGNPVIEAGFFGLGPSSTFYCKRGSSAEEYARSISAQVEYIDDDTAENEGVTLTEEREEDIASFEDKFGKGSFERFNRLKGRMKNSGIPVDIVFHTKNTDPVTMRQFLDDAENRVVKDVQTGETKLNRKLVAENDHYTVWDVLDWETAMNMGDGTTWCIAGRYNTNEVKPSQAKKYFNEYKQDRIKSFLYFMPKGDEEKYCMAISTSDSFQFWDSSDKSLRRNIPPVNAAIPEIDYAGVKVREVEKNGWLYVCGNTIVGHDGDAPDSFSIPEGITSIDIDAFIKCSFRSVKLPSTLERIGEGAFEKCTNLEEIVVPDSCNFIGMCAFDGCSSLKRVVLPKNMTEIRAGAFRNCPSLERLDIPNGVMSLDEQLLSGDTSIKEVIIPDTVYMIDNAVFDGCTSLQKVRLPESIRSINSFSFFGVADGFTVQCNKGSYAAAYARQHNLKCEYVD